MYVMTGSIKHYAWGGTHYIPKLLSTHNPESKPFAEYWLGTHPGGQSRIWLSETASTGLVDLIRSEPRRYLGKNVVDLFGELPFLLKVLDVKGMLSIQVHPNKEEAKKGFDRENEAGIPLDAPNRNYKDANHKPEVMVALSDFWLLHGFNPRLAEILENHEVLGPLLPLLESKGLQGLYKYVMELPQAGVDDMLRPLAEKIVPLYEDNQLSKSSPDFWAAKVMSESKPSFENLDRGIFSIYFFNILHLNQGEAIYQGAGVPHAYLEGQNIELMSNSDNVLRAGLTPKHMDIPELMKHTQFEFIHPEIMRGDILGKLINYNCPIPDFQLHALTLQAGESFSDHSRGPEIWIMLKGKADWTGFRSVQTQQGQAVFVIPDEYFTLHAQEDSQLFRAIVP
jgi:mannose-6-phosphate isomerase